MKRFVALIAIAVLSLSHSGRVEAHKSHHQKERDQAASQSKDFDYYLLSLSWSPSFCATHPQERDQCGGQGYGFVLHGLWPEYTAGGGPQHCSATSKPDEATMQSMLKVSPSRGLIAHEWQTHGACSGLEPAEYFAGAQKAFRAIRIPPAIATATTSPALSARDISDAFVAANPGLERGMLAVKCDGITLSEVRICVNKDFAPQQCGARIATDCHKGNLKIPLAKGQR